MELVESFYLTAIDKDKVGRQSWNSSFGEMLRKNKHRETCYSRVDVSYPRLAFSRHKSVYRYIESAFRLTGFETPGIRRFPGSLLQEAESHGFVKFPERFERNAAEIVSLPRCDDNGLPMENKHLAYGVHGFQLDGIQREGDRDLSVHRQSDPPRGFGLRFRPVGKVKR